MADLCPDRILETIDAVSFYCYLFAGAMLASLMVACGPSRWQSRLWRFAVVLLLFVPAAIRCDIGTDYYRIYAPIIDNGLCHADGAYQEWEPAVQAICQLIIREGLATQWFFAITAAITCFAAVMSFPRKGFPWCVLVFFVVGYLPSYNIVRQMLAVSLSMLAFSLYLQRRVLWSILFFVAAVLFHKSIVLCVPIVVLAFSACRFPPSALLCCCLGLAVFLALANPIQIALEVLERIPVVSSYLSYESRENFMESGVKTGLGLVLWCVVELALGTFILLRGKGRCYRVTALLCLMAFLVKLASAKVYIIDRLSLFTEAILPFAMCFAWRLRRGVADTLLVLGVAMLVVFALIYNYGFDSKAPGAHEVLPYQTIFD